MTTPFAAVSEPLWIYTLMRFIGFSKSSFTMSDGIRLPVPGGRFMKIQNHRLETALFHIHHRDCEA